VRWWCGIIPILIVILCCVSARAETAAEGGGNPKIVIIEFHGMKAGILDETLDGLPHFREMVKGPGDTQSYVFLPRVLVTIPAASVPGISSMYTGLTPQRTGVVSTIWYDRTDYKVRTMISYFQQRINNILEKNGVNTLFDYIGMAGGHSLTSMLMVTKGADWSIKSGAYFWGNASTLGLFEKGFWFPSSPYIDERAVRGFLDGHLFSYPKSLQGLLRYKNLVPDVMVIQLLGTDLDAHYPSAHLMERHASMDEIQKVYTRQVLDPIMGELVQGLKDAGCYDDVIFVFVSEHGFTKIETHVPDDTVDKSLSGYFRLPGIGTVNKEAEAVVMPGASTKEVYLKNRATDNWFDPPRLCHDVKPAVDLLLDNADITESMHTLIVRQYPGERNEGVIENDAWWVFDWHTYCRGARDDQSFLQALLPLQALGERFELGDYLIRSLRQQYTRPTTPDLKVINKKGYLFEKDHRKYGHHGSYYPSDCVVSFWVAGPGLASVIPGRHVIEEYTSTMDLVPLVMGLLGLSQPEGLNGTDPLRNIRR